MEDAWPEEGHGNAPTASKCVRVLELAQCKMLHTALLTLITLYLSSSAECYSRTTTVCAQCRSRNTGLDEATQQQQLWQTACPLPG